MLKEPVAITAISSLSALGSKPEAIFNAYLNPRHHLTYTKIGNQSVWVGQLPELEKEELEQLRTSDSKYKNLDDSVLFSIYTARKAIKNVGWKAGDNFGINIGSSRGATSLFENYHQTFLRDGKTAALTSPTTTLGNIASWVAHDLQTSGPIISHSITCSTALHALLNGIAWLQGGMADKFLVGGSEAPLTSFTLAQMKALKIYSSSNAAYPCRALELEKTKNTMVLGESAAMACLEKGVSDNAIARIIGIGYATEILEHNVSISSDAKCFQDSMKMALGDFSPDEIDAIVMHAPGTIKGDISEYQAIKKVFCNKTPFLTTNKWKVGHTFGASGMLSIEMAILMLKHQRPLPVPYVDYDFIPEKFDKILVNAVGFGGNAVSVLLQKP